MGFPLHFIIYYGSFLAFPFLIILGWFYFKKIHRKIVIFLLILSLLFIYARFIEPSFLIVKEQIIKGFQIENNNSLKNSSTEIIKVAVFSDIHLGIYNNQDLLNKIVEKINKENPDIVLIPGDFIYYISEQDLLKIFAPMKDIKAPVFAVTGNHDAEKPGEYSSDQVRAAIQPFDVNFIDNKKTTLEIKGRKFTLIGLSDIWEGKTDYSIVEDILPEENTIILVHNPDAAYSLPNNYADLVVAGHTHGGQIRIPFIYKYAIPTDHDFDQGLYNLNGVQVFVTSGAGEVGLPMRFLVPPEIVILKL